MHAAQAPHSARGSAPVFRVSYSPSCVSPKACPSMRGLPSRRTPARRTTSESAMFISDSGRTALRPSAGLRVPRLLQFDDDLWVIEMTIVSRPFVLDFAGAYLDMPPDFSDEVMADWHAENARRRNPEARTSLAADSPSQPGRSCRPDAPRRPRRGRGARKRAGPPRLPPPPRRGRNPRRGGRASSGGRGSRAAPQPGSRATARPGAPAARRRAPRAPAGRAGR